MQNTDLQLLHAVTGCDVSKVQYLPDGSYPCGIRNCCYHHTYSVEGQQYSVECHCGCCEPVEQGKKVIFIIEQITQKEKL